MQKKRRYKRYSTMLPLLALPKEIAGRAGQALASIAHDVSAGGMGLMLVESPKRAVKKGETLTLVLKSPLKKTSVKMEVEVVWQKGRQLGVRIVEIAGTHRQSYLSLLKALSHTPA